jgi:hypothetical protein
LEDRSHSEGVARSIKGKPLPYDRSAECRLMAR